MSDTALRELERQARVEAIEAGVALLRLQLRSGLIDRGLVRARAYAGWPAGMVLAGACGTCDGSGKTHDPLALKGGCGECQPSGKDGAKRWTNGLPSLLAEVRLPERQVPCCFVRRSDVYGGGFGHDIGCKTCRGTGSRPYTPNARWLLVYCALAVALEANARRLSGLFSSCWDCHEGGTCPRHEGPTLALVAVQEWLDCPCGRHAAGVLVTEWTNIVWVDCLATCALGHEEAVVPQACDAITSAAELGVDVRKAVRESLLELP